MASDRPYNVVYAPDVSAQLESALRWWAEHRDKAPGLLTREFERALALIAATPELGQRARTSRFGRLHRMLLPKSKYHVYYRIFESETRVDIVLFRQAQRRPLR